MRIDILTPFPELITGAFDESMIRKAREKNLVEIRFWDIREEAQDKHNTVDDYPYGGGAGMILKPEPIFRTIDKISDGSPDQRRRVLFMTPQGKQFDQTMARDLSSEDHLIFICGHYRGVDERVIEHLVTDEISIGDYILTGGELAAAVISDAVIRLLPGVLGNFDSAEGDSFTSGLLDHPHYTRPEVYRDYKVPDVLLTGHHANVESWRKQKSLERTRLRRPDLYEKYSKKTDDQKSQ
jgi:tRNA (guanine37-N1)-methyltransferase